MKKIFLVLTILLMAVSYSSAQSYSFLGENGNENSATDGFFSKTYSEYREENLEWGTMPLLCRPSVDRLCRVGPWRARYLHDRLWP